MILYKVLRYLIIDEAIGVFLKILKNNIRPNISRIINDGMRPSLRFPDANIYECIEDGKVKWGAFDDDNFPIGFYATEDEALLAWLDNFPDYVDPDDDL
jgi:hypothetical protein